MDFFRGLNKEQCTAMIAVGLSSLLLLFGIGGGVAPGAEALKNGAEEPYNALAPRYVELPSENFPQYWSKKIFPTESTVRLALPVLKAPEPCEEEMPVPAFRPGPAWELYNAGRPGEVPDAHPRSPMIAGNLPTAAEVASCGQGPAQQGKADLRKEGARARDHPAQERRRGESRRSPTRTLLSYKDKGGVRKRSRWPR